MNKRRKLEVNGVDHVDHVDHYDDLDDYDYDSDDGNTKRATVIRAIKEKKGNAVKVVTLRYAKEFYKLKENDLIGLDCLLFNDPKVIKSSETVVLYKLNEIIQVVKNKKDQEAKQKEEARINLKKERIAKIESSCKIKIDEIKG